jgi:hypothetical protein
MSFLKNFKYVMRSSLNMGDRFIRDHLSSNPEDAKEWAKIGGREDLLPKDS